MLCKQKQKKTPNTKTCIACIMQSVTILQNLLLLFMYGMQNCQLFSDYYFLPSCHHAHIKQQIVALLFVLYADLLLKNHFWLGEDKKDKQWWSTFPQISKNEQTTLQSLHETYVCNNFRQNTYIWLNKVSSNVTHLYVTEPLMSDVTAMHNLCLLV